MTTHPQQRDEGEREDFLQRLRRDNSGYEPLSRAWCSIAEINTLLDYAAGFTRRRDEEHTDALIRAELAEHKLKRYQDEFGDVDGLRTYVGKFQAQRDAAIARAEQAEADRDHWKRLNEAEVDGRVKAQEAVADAYRAMNIRAPIQPLVSAIGYMVEQHGRALAREKALREALTPLIDAANDAVWHAHVSSHAQTVALLKAANAARAALASTTPDDGAREEPQPATCINCGKPRCDGHDGDSWERCARRHYAWSMQIERRCLALLKDHGIALPNGLR